jgi:TolB-like protein
MTKAVFLSHASQDAEPVARICASLRAAGVEVWFDQSELRGGDVWDQAIHRQIRDCALFIPVISAHTQERLEGYFRREWKLAVARTHDMADEKRFIVPVVIDATNEQDATVPELFRAVQWTRLPAGETPASFSNRIAALLGGTAREGRSATPAPISSAVPAVAKPPSRRWTAVVVVAALVLAVTAWQTWKVLHTSSVPATRPVHSSEVVPSASDKSIAVLPFVDMSEKKDQEYFSDGLSEELINQLSHNADLKVIARTSSFAFKGKNEDMRTIASKLGVANLLEGSVRKAGAQLRITAQLIRASDGVHLWSETYERKLDDIFKVQDEISSTVAKALNVALGVGSRPAAAQATSSAAYNLMLQGNYFFYRGTPGDLDKAIGLYKQVIAQEPKNALAWARLAEAYVDKGGSAQMPVDRARAVAQDAVQKALALDPNLPRAHYVLGLIYSNMDLNWDAAVSEYERAVALDAHGDVSADAKFNGASITAFKQGRLDGLIDTLQQTIQRSPLEPGNYNLLGIMQYAAGNLDQSVAAYHKLLDLDAAYIGAHANYAATLMAMGKLPEALLAAEQEPDQLSRYGVLPCIYWKLGRRADSDVALKTLQDRFGGSAALSAARNHACRGEVDAAFAQLERAYQQHDGDLQAITVDPLLRSLHSDPRYREFLRKLKYPLM